MIRVNNPYEVAWRPCMMVQDLLDALRYTFRMIAIKVNGEPALQPDFASTPAPNGAEVQAIHMISGG